MNARARRGRWRRPLVLALVLLAADQTIQWTVLRDGTFAGRRVIPFDPPLFTEWQRHRAADVAAMAAGDEALRARSMIDPELGWCPRAEQEVGLSRHDWSGSRIQLAPLARTKAPGVRRAVAVGCSFTEGAEVEGEETWSALLDARHADLEVANLGQGGYGTDQAYLRFRRDGLRLAPDEVWLGFLPESVLRITAQFPAAANHWSTELGFKPMFVLARGPGGADGDTDRNTDRNTDGEVDELELVPSPAPDAVALHALLSDQAAFVAACARADHWVRRAPLAFAPRGSSWTHWFACTRLFATWLESGARDPAPYLRAREGDVYRLLRALVLRLAHESEHEGAHFRLIVLPSRPDLESARGREGAYWTPLIADLEARGVECIDTTAALLAAGADSEARFWMPGRHYSPEAHRVVAARLEHVLFP